MNALVLEGSPHSVMKGWRHFQVIIRHNGGVKVTSALGQNGQGEKFARDLQGKFFAEGTWENHAGFFVSHETTKFSPPKVEVLDELFRGGAK